MMKKECGTIFIDMDSTKGKMKVLKTEESTVVMNGHHRYRSMLEYEQALEESETRRRLLLQKMQDAQAIIREYMTQKKSNMQNQRMVELERTCSDRLETENTKSKEDGYQSRITFLEKESWFSKEKLLEQLKIKEDLQKKNDMLNGELSTLRSTLLILQSECRRKDAQLENNLPQLRILEADNYKLSLMKDEKDREVTTLRESLEMAKKQNDHLEKQLEDGNKEMERVKKTFSNSIDETVRNQRNLTAVSSKCSALEEDNNKIASKLQTAIAEKEKLAVRVRNLEDKNSETAAEMKILVLNKDRFIQEKLELHQEIQNLRFEKETFEKNRQSLEEQLCELTSDLDQYKMAMQRSSEEKRHLQEELTANKVVSDVLSHDLSECNVKFNKHRQYIQSLEDKNRRLQLEIEDLKNARNNTEKELDHSRVLIEVERTDYMSNTKCLEGQISSLKQEILQVTSDRDTLQLKCEEIENKKIQIENEFLQDLRLITIEKDNWMKNCEKLTTSQHQLERDLEKSLKDAKQENTILMTLKNNLKDQIKENSMAQTEIERLVKEIEVLMKEKKEKEMKIESLELRLREEQLKNILPENKLVNKFKLELEDLHDEVQHMRTVKNLVSEKLSTLEKENTSLKIEKKHLCSLSDYRVLENERSRLEELNHILKQQLDQAEKARCSQQSDVQDKSKRLLENEERMNFLMNRVVALENCRQLLEERNNTLAGELEKLTQNENDRKLEDHIDSLMKENCDLKSTVAQMSNKITELESTVSLMSLHIEELSKEKNDSFKEEHDNELKRLNDRFRKEINSKDRQIESLEEQLSRTTDLEIRKRKRDSSKVESLQADNRRLMQLLSLVESNGSKLLEIEEDASSDLLMPGSIDPSMPGSIDPSMPGSIDPSMPGNCSESCNFLTDLPMPVESFINACHQDSDQSDPGCMLGASDLHSDIRMFDAVVSTVNVDETQNRTESVEAPCCELKQSTANDGWVDRNSNIEGRNIGINFKPVENVRSKSLAVTVIGKLSNRDGKSQSQELLSQTRKRSLQDAIKLNRYLRRGSLPFGDKTARKVSDFALSFVGERHYSIDLSRSKSFERLPNFSRRGSELISNQDYSYDVTEDEELFLKLRVRPLLNNLEFELAAAEACEDDCESLYMIKDLSPDEDGDEKISTARYMGHPSSIPDPQEISCLD